MHKSPWDPEPGSSAWMVCLDAPAHRQSLLCEYIGANIHGTNAEASLGELSLWKRKIKVNIGGLNRVALKSLK